MAKLFFSRLVVVLILLSYSYNYAQVEYGVFKVKGTPKQVDDLGHSISLQKGMFFSKGYLIMEANEEIILVDKVGVLYTITEPGSYRKSSIVDYKKSIDDASFNKKYFSYVWKQMLQKDKTQEHTGVVYRNSKMDFINFPLDSTLIYKEKVTFSWKNKKETTYYFHLKNISDNTITKFELDGSKITLFADGNILKKGQPYEWTLSTEAYPDLITLEYFKFNLLTSSEYEQKMIEMEQFISDLKFLEYTDSEIAETLCDYFNLCN